MTKFLTDVKASTYELKTASSVLLIDWVHFFYTYIDFFPENLSDVTED